MTSTVQLLRGLREARATRWVPPDHVPHPKQAEFLALTCREALYGGAAGGGKSDALLMAALQYVDVPGHNAILFRKTFTDLALPEAIMDRARQWLQGTKAHWDGMNRQFRFPSSSRLSFGYLKTSANRYRYQGAAFQFIGFDELTQFESADYRYLFSRLRGPRWMNVPLRMRSASNPGGIGHDWVEERFISGKSAQRVFVPATLEDNPSLNAEEYEESLAELDAHTREQLRWGVWARDPSGLVYKASRGNYISKPQAGEWIHALGLDFGVADRNAITVAGWRRHSPQVTFKRSYYFVGGPTPMAKEVREVMKAFEPVKIIGDTGGLGKAYAEEMITRFGIPVEAADKTNKLGYQKLMNGALERAEVLACIPGCEDLKAEWEALPKDSKGREIEGHDNHCADSALYIWRWCKAHYEEPAEELPTGDEVLRQFENRVIEDREKSLRKEWWE